MALEAPRTVLLTTDVVGGVWDFCCALAAELTRSGRSVGLLAFGQPTDEQRRQAARAGAELRSADLKLEWMRDSAGDLPLAREAVARYAEEIGAEVVHANQYAIGSLAGGVPVVLTAHSDVLGWLRWNVQGALANGAPPEWLSYADVVRGGLEDAEAAVAVSRLVADDLAELYWPRTRIEVVHNGWAAPDREGRPAGTRPRLTLMAGRAWDSAKNVALGVEGARGWSSGRVVLVGDQRHPESGAAAEIGRPVEAVGWLGRDEVDRWLGWARVYLAPARYEPFGLLPLQAALAGCALLLSDIASFRELWDGAALFFRSDDADDLRRQWRRLLDEDGLASELAARAGRRARERYSADRMAADYLRIYQRVLVQQPAMVVTA